MKKKIGIIPTKKQQKDFFKFIESKSFYKSLLTAQWSGNICFKILNFNDNKTCWFCSLDNQYFLYNEKTKNLLYYGTLYDDKNPPKIESSKDIPWKEIK